MGSDTDSPLLRAPIVVLWKWVDLRPEIDPLTGAVTSGDVRFGGVGASDRAALEIALQLGEAHEVPVIVMTAGPHEAEIALRDALACGAERAIRVDLAMNAPSATVAAVLAATIETTIPDAALVICGDYSPDRGSGSVPAFLAAHRRCAQALGVVSVDVPTDATGGSHLRLRRRLDGGRREHLVIRGPAVVSVEGSTATLRRASLSASLARSRHEITVVPGPDLGDHPVRPTRPVRPRPRELAGPRGASALDRIRELTGAGATATKRRDPVSMTPRDAALAILDAVGVPRPDHSTDAPSSTSTDS